LVGHHKISIVGLDPTPVPKGEEKALPTPEEAPLDFLKSRVKGAQRLRTPPRRAAGAAPGDTFTDRGGRVYRYIIPKKLGLPEESGLKVDVARGSNTFSFEVAEDGSVHIEKR
jgi:hypothetical protein